MAERMKGVFGEFIYLLIWLILAICITFTAFQVHSMLIAVGLFVVNTPAIRPTGWNTPTVYGLSRLLWLILGIFWLVGILYCEADLREGKELQILKIRAIKLFSITGGIYLLSYIVFLLL